MSNGEPPPESEFDSWLLPVGRLLGAVSDVGAALAVGIARLAVLSRVRPDDDGSNESLEACVVLVEGAMVVVAGVDVLVLNCKVVRAVEEGLGLAEVCLLLGHSAATPMSFWKTPIMEVSPTSTPAQPVLTAAPIFASPAKQPELQVAPRLKSEETQASILVS